MIEIKITRWMIDNALALSEELGSLKNSIRNGFGNLAGFLGEECILEYFPEAERANTYQHDIYYKGYTIEAKTKDRTGRPWPNYEVSISNHNPNQAADYYFFVSLLRRGEDYTKGYLCGYMSPTEYFQKARLLKKGGVDRSNNFTVRTECWNLPISELRRFRGDVYDKSTKRLYGKESSGS